MANIIQTQSLTQPTFIDWLFITSQHLLRVSPTTEAAAGVRATHVVTGARVSKVTPDACATCAVTLGDYAARADGRFEPRIVQRSCGPPRALLRASWL